ncbi:glycosyltransferase family 39 protein [Candidatus Avelusimicrobium sp.]|uniref:glycosyltransferase family 39 protein n=1 Tax=Candidatus Avelusimicrobium sp. TaxID=3048833 RepID=UPI003D7C892F
MKINPLLRVVLPPVLLMALGGLYSVFVGQDVNWDLLNYHLYNPFAFLNGKIGQDFMAAGVHSCLNPLPDVYFYLLFKCFFYYPRVIAFFMGVPYGLLAWAVYLLAKELFAKTSYPRALSAAAAAVGVTAAGVMSQIGMTTNEIPLAVLNVWALWFLVRFVQGKFSVRAVYGAAFLAGLATGLKLTSAPYAVALLAGFLLCWKQQAHPVKNLLWFCVCGAAGFLLADGYFLWKWYSLYGNPVFPYYNQLFHSPYFDPVFVTETRFFPKTLVQWLFYPFYWVVRPAALVTEVPVQDMRLAAGLVALAVSVFLFLRRKMAFGRIFTVIGVYFAVAYILWLTQFSILRYAAVLEVLSGLILVGFIARLVRGRWGAYLAWGLLAVLALGYQVPDWRHGEYFKQAVVFDKKPVIEDNSLVFFMHLPSSYLAPLLNPKAIYMGGFLYHPEDYPLHEQERAAKRNNIQPQYLRYHFEEAQRQKIAAHDGPIYLVSIDWPELVNDNALKRFGLQGKLENCHPFMTNWTIYSPQLAICRVEKRPR